ncbi:MAG TPA: MarR family transcriptional regulator [Actinopolymorphaceae bacterium]
MSESRLLGEREARAWCTYNKMREHLAAVLNQRLQRDSGLSEADYVILAALAEAPEGRLRALELRCQIGWEKSRLSHQVARMQQRGLVRKHLCPTDARSAEIEITPEGRAAIEAAAPTHIAAAREYFLDLLSPEQLDVLAEIGDIVLGHLARHTRPSSR